MSRNIQFIFQRDVQKIFDHFTRLFGIRIVFFSYDGTELGSGQGRPNCRYCQLLREKLDHEPLCRKLDRDKQILAAEVKTLISYQCHGGMTEAVLPVYHVEKLLGYIMIGQFRTTDRMPAKLKNLWAKQYGDTALADAFYEAPFYHSEKVEDILAIFSVLVHYIVSNHLIEIQRFSSLHKIINYIAEHPDEMLSLAEAAELTNKSPSCFAHQFKEATGTSFRRYQIDRRLELADKLMRTEPQLSISQIAYRLGYEDPLYFSKVYKKSRGLSPSAAKTKLAKNSHSKKD